MTTAAFIATTAALDAARAAARNAAAKPGTGATIFVGTDCYGATVVEATPRRIVVQYDASRQVGDYWGSQVWEHSRNPNGRLQVFTLRTVKGIKFWAEEGRSSRSSYRLSVGERKSYRDPSF